MSAKSVVWHMVRYQLFGGGRKFWTYCAALFLYPTSLIIGENPRLAFVLFPMLALVSSLLLSGMIGNQVIAFSEFLSTGGVQRAAIFRRQLLISTFFVIVPLLIALSISFVTTGEHETEEGDMILHSYYLDDGSVREIEAVSLDELKPGGGRYGGRVWAWRVPYGRPVAIILLFLFLWLFHMMVIAFVQGSIGSRRITSFSILIWVALMMCGNFRVFRCAVLQAFYWTSLFPWITVTAILLAGVLATRLSWRRFQRAEIG